MNIRETVLGLYGRQRAQGISRRSLGVFKENECVRVLAPPPSPPTSYPILVGLISRASSILQFVGQIARRFPLAPFLPQY